MNRSLWGLMWITLAASAWADETTAILHLRKFGATVQRDRALRGEPVTIIHCHSPQFADEHAKHLREFPDLMELHLGSTGITDAGLAELAGLKQLRELSISGTKVTGPGLRHLGGLKHLRSLDMARTRLASEHLALLSSLEQLEVLRLSGAGVDDSGLKAIGRLKHLRKLDLGGARVTDEGMAALSDLAQLEDLALTSARITGEGLKHLRGLKRLRRLDLSQNSRLSDLALGELARIPRLTSLSLRGTNVKGLGLSELAELDELVSLDLTRTKLSAAGLKELGELTQLRSLFLTLEASDASLRDLGQLKDLRFLAINGAQATDDALQGLVPFKELETLDLGGAPLSGAGLAHLTPLKNLKRLKLGHSGLTNAGMKGLGRLRQLQSVMLNGTQISDEGLKELPNVDLLFDVNLTNTQVTGRGVRDLQATFPRCHIVWAPPPPAAAKSGAVASANQRFRIKELPVANRTAEQVQLLHVSVNEGPAELQRDRPILLVWRGKQMPQPKMGAKEPVRPAFEYIVTRLGAAGGVQQEVGRLKQSMHAALRAVDIESGCLVLTHKELFRIADGKTAKFDADNGLPAELLLDCAPLEGKVYLGVAGGLIAFDPKTERFETLASVKSLAPKHALDGGDPYFVVSLLADPERRCLWAAVQSATRGGLWKITPHLSRWEHVRKERISTLVWSDGKLFFQSLELQQAVRKAADASRYALFDPATETTTWLAGCQFDFGANPQDPAARQFFKGQLLSVPGFLAFQEDSAWKVEPFMSFAGGQQSPGRWQGVWRLGRGVLVAQHSSAVPAPDPIVAQNPSVGYAGLWYLERRETLSEK
jgi:hypothetical protein